MKKADIKPGQVYAYKDRPSSYSTEQIKFLTPLSAPMYTYESRRDQRIKVSASYSAPKSFQNYPNHGYLVAIGRDVSGATFEEGLGSRATVYADPENKTYRYVILARLNQVYGPTYSEFTRVEQERRERESAARNEQNAEWTRTHRELERAKATLANFGVHADLGYANELVIHPVAADRLRIVLEQFWNASNPDLPPYPQEPAAPAAGK